MRHTPRVLLFVELLANFRISFSLQPLFPICMLSSLASGATDAAVAASRVRDEVALNVRRASAGEPGL